MKKLPKNKLESTQAEIDTIMKEAREKIESILNARIPKEHDHTVIGYRLKSVAEQIGTDFANQLVDEYDLTEAFGIEKVEGQ